MTHPLARRLAALLLPMLLLGLAGCEEAAVTAVAPPPQELTREAIGNYCSMIVVDHQGPKGQIFLEGQAEPLWFTSVRDTVAYTMLPEEVKSIAAIYVTDVGRADWDNPEPGTWTEARSAWFVVGSDRVGGMGAPETVPFSDKALAMAFAEKHGGRVMTFTEIPADAVLGYVEAGDGHGSHSAHQAHGESSQ